MKRNGILIVSTNLYLNVLLDFIFWMKLARMESPDEGLLIQRHDFDGVIIMIPIQC